MRNGKRNEKEGDLSFEKLIRVGISLIFRANPWKYQFKEK